MPDSAGKLAFLPRAAGTGAGMTKTPRNPAFFSRDIFICNLGKLTQEKSVQAYTTHFRNLAQEVEWNCEALIDKFKGGLKPDVRQELLKLELYGALEDSSLEEWIAIACWTDDILFATKHLEKRIAPYPKREIPLKGSPM
ncbi:hypothetical protein FRC08_017602 [Ceratobasidium sp. 394]|nr:hypothetical protein FRC08_017602 [Ceratobasidium sp. 394]